MHHYFCYVMGNVGCLKPPFIFLWKNSPKEIEELLCNMFLQRFRWWASSKLLCKRATEDPFHVLSRTQEHADRTSPLATSPTPPPTYGRGWRWFPERTYFFIDDGLCR